MMYKTPEAEPLTLHTNLTRIARESGLKMSTEHISLDQAVAHRLLGQILESVKTDQLTKKNRSQTVQSAPDICVGLLGNLKILEETYINKRLIRRTDPGQPRMISNTPRKPSNDAQSLGTLSRRILALFMADEVAYQRFLHNKMPARPTAFFSDNKNPSGHWRGLLDKKERDDLYTGPENNIITQVGLFGNFSASVCISVAMAIVGAERFLEAVRAAKKDKDESEYIGDIALAIRRHVLRYRVEEILGNNFSEEHAMFFERRCKNSKDKNERLNFLKAVQGLFRKNDDPQAAKNMLGSEQFAPSAGGISKENLVNGNIVLMWWFGLWFGPSPTDNARGSSLAAMVSDWAKLNSQDSVETVFEKLPSTIFGVTPSPDRHGFYSNESAPEVTVPGLNNYVPIFKIATKDPNETDASPMVGAGITPRDRLDNALKSAGKKKAHELQQIIIENQVLDTFTNFDKTGALMAEFKKPWPFADVGGAFEVAWAVMRARAMAIEKITVATYNEETEKWKMGGPKMAPNARNTSGRIPVDNFMALSLPIYACYKSTEYDEVSKTLTLLNKNEGDEADQQ